MNSLYGYILCSGDQITKWIFQYECSLDTIEFLGAAPPLTPMPPLKQDSEIHCIAHSLSNGIIHCKDGPILLLSLYPHTLLCNFAVFSHHGQGDLLHALISASTTWGQCFGQWHVSQLRQVEAWNGLMHWDLVSRALVTALRIPGAVCWKMKYT